MGEVIGPDAGQNLLGNVLAIGFEIAATDAIFERLSQVNPQADADQTKLRLSLDAKATVKVGDYSRGGSNRIPVEAADHDFHPEALVTPTQVLPPEPKPICFLDAARRYEIAVWASAFARSASNSS